MCIIALIAGIGFFNASRISPNAAANKPASDESQWHGLPDYLNDPKAGSQQVELLARKSGGDFDKLTKDEQSWLNALTAGHGARMLEMKAQESREQQKARRRSHPADSMVNSH